MHGNGQRFGAQVTCFQTGGLRFMRMLAAAAPPPPPPKAAPAYEISAQRQPALVRHALHSHAQTHAPPPPTPQCGAAVTAPHHGSPAQSSLLAAQSAGERRAYMQAEHRLPPVRQKQLIQGLGIEACGRHAGRWCCAGDCMVQQRVAARARSQQALSGSVSSASPCAKLCKGKEGRESTKHMEAGRHTPRAPHYSVHHSGKHGAHPPVLRADGCMPVHVFGC